MILPLLMLKMRIFQINLLNINIKSSHLIFIQTTRKSFLLRYKITLLFKVSEEKWVARKKLKELISLFKTLGIQRDRSIKQTWNLAGERKHRKRFNLKRNKKRFYSQVWKVSTQMTRLWCKFFQIKKIWLRNLYLDHRIP